MALPLGALEALPLPDCEGRGLDDGEAEPHSVGSADVVG